MIASQQPPSLKPSESDTSLAPSRSDETQMYCWSEDSQKLITVRRPKGLVGWCCLDLELKMSEVNNIWNFFLIMMITLNCTSAMKYGENSRKKHIHAVR
jgi:hypothetical protein